MVFFGCKQLLMLLSIRGGRRRHVSNMYHQVFASYLKPSSIFFPILPPVSSMMPALRNSVAFYKMRLKPAPGALILTKEHNFISYLLISCWQLKCGQLGQKVNEHRELGRHSMYGYTTE